MTLGFDTLLVLGALAFYLQDSCQLLYADELVLEQVHDGWRAHGGASALVAGRRPYLPNPLAPHRALVRSDLGGLLDGDPAPAYDVGTFLRALAPFRWLALVLLALFVAALPLVLRFLGPGAALLAWMSIVYAVIACIACLLWRRRRALGLSTRACTAIAFECAVCPPFAINIVRKLSLRAAVAPLADYPGMSAPRSRRSLHRVANDRIDQLLAWHEPDDPRARRLLLQRDALRGPDDEGRPGGRDRPGA